MLLISCPWCGPRDEEEFRCGGQSDRLRPQSPDLVTDEQWARYLFERINPKGAHRERWVHAYGCRRWFNLTRNTVTHSIKDVDGLDRFASSASVGTVRS